MVGSIDIGMPMSAAIVGSHCKVRRSMSNVRDAFVTSVMCRPPVAPPVRFQINQLSVLPNNRSPRSAASRAPSTFSRIQAIFGPEK